MPPAVYPIELAPPDLTGYRSGNTPIDYVHTFDSGRDGQHVCVNALTHGNEICGALVLDWMLREEVRPMRGRLSLSFANVGAFERFDPAKPHDSRFVDEDFNRVWDKLDDDSRPMSRSAERKRARALRPFYASVDQLLDIHSMTHPTVPLMLSGPLDKGIELAHALASPEHVLADAGHPSGMRLRDWSHFGDPGDRRNALLIECGQHWAKASETVARQVTLRFLRHFEAIDPDFTARHLDASSLPSQKTISVTHAITPKTGAFRFAGDYTGMEVIAKAGTPIAFDNDTPITTPYDECVLVMPARRLEVGTTAVRLGRYV